MITLSFVIKIRFFLFLGERKIDIWRNSKSSFCTLPSAQEKKVDGNDTTMKTIMVTQQKEKQLGRRCYCLEKRAEKEEKVIYLLIILSVIHPWGLTQSSFSFLHSCYTHFSRSRDVQKSDSYFPPKKCTIPCPVLHTGKRDFSFKMGNERVATDIYFFKKRAWDHCLQKYISGNRKVTRESVCVLFSSFLILLLKIHILLSISGYFVLFFSLLFYTFYIDYVFTLYVNSPYKYRMYFMMQGEIVCLDFFSCFILSGIISVLSFPVVVLCKCSELNVTQDVNVLFTDEDLWRLASFLHIMKAFWISFLGKCCDIEKNIYSGEERRNSSSHFRIHYHHHHHHGCEIFFLLWLHNSHANRCWWKFTYAHFPW